MCAYGLDAAHALARAEWRSWVEAEAEVARQVEEARAARQGDAEDVRYGIAAGAGRLRRAIGSGLIGIGQRVQGTAATRAAS